MGGDKVYRFSSYRFDSRDGRLWKGREFLHLRPKTLALLHYLLIRPGELATKHQLLSALWPKVTVAEAGLSVCIHELRQALDDDAHHPRFIETAHGLGYRFIGEISVPDGEDDEPRRIRTLPSNDSVIVGREAEMLRLRQFLEQALAGTRRVVLVSGESGVGKSRLTNSFLDFVQTSRLALVGYGQCAESYGEGEAYLPVLNALSHMCDGVEGKDTRDILQSHAPAWLVHLSGLLKKDESERIRIQSTNLTPEQMLRQFAEALELLTATRPVVLVLEDLHVSDRSTLELLAFFAARRQAARLLLLATYRTGQPSRQAHPLPQFLQELRSGDQLHEIHLEGLPEAAVGDYLRRRLDIDAIPAALAHQVYRRTGGNALFLAAIAEHLRANVSANGARTLPDKLVESGVPDNIRRTIQQQVERLSSDDQRLLEAASVAGTEFSAAALSAGLNLDAAPLTTEQIEHRCEELVHNSSFLCASGFANWPDGTIAAGYGFRHSLYQEVLYDRMSPASRRRVHRRIAERLEAAYGEHADRIAAELATHFERGGENRRAVKYLTICAGTALSLSANQEAIAYAERGLKLLELLPTDPDGQKQELDLQLLLGSAHTSTNGFGAPKVEQVYQRARKLAAQIGETPAIFPALHGLARFYLVRRELQTALALGERCLHLAQTTHDTSDLLATYVTLTAILYAKGEFSAALAHAEKSIDTYAPEKHGRHALVYGLDSAIAATAYVGLCLWHLGYPDQAKRRGLEALAMGQELSHPHSMAFAIASAASVRARCRDWVALQSFAERLSAYTAEKEVPFWHAWAVFYRGQALSQQGDRAAGPGLMRASIDELRATGADSMHAQVLTALTEVELNTLTAEKGMCLVEEALADSERTTELFNQAEHYRIMGVLKLRSGKPHNQNTIQPEAEECFLKAIEISRRQNAKSFELRAAMDLSRLWQRQGKSEQALQILTEIYGWFTEGFSTGDLKEAKTLIDELG